jgi:hypothetical protein
VFCIALYVYLLHMCCQVLLRQHGVVLLHHVKPRLMERIARLTGAQILPSIDSVMNRYASHFESNEASMISC